MRELLGCFCECFTASRLAVDRVVSPIGLDKSLSAVHIKAAEWFDTAVFMTCSVWWHYSLGHPCSVTHWSRGDWESGCP